MSWRLRTQPTRIVAFPSPLYVVKGRVKMRVRVGGEFRMWEFGPSILHALRPIFGPCPAPQVLDVHWDVLGRQPRFCVRVVTHKKHSVSAL